MFNPFSKFEPRFIDAFKTLKRYYLVSQTFTRDNDLFTKPDKYCIIITAHAEESQAVIHKKAILHDKFASIIDLRNDKHVATLLTMLEPGSKYIVYSSIISNPDIVKQTLDKNMKQNIIRYLEKNTNWRIGRDQEIMPKPQLKFGELFLHISFGNQTVNPRFSDVEKA